MVEELVPLIWGVAGGEVPPLFSYAAQEEVQTAEKWDMLDK